MKQYLKERRHAVHNKWVLRLNSMEEIEKSDDPESAYVCYKNRVDKLSNEIDKLDDLIQEEESIEEVLEEARHTLTWINGLWATDVPELIEDGGYENINDLLFYISTKEILSELDNVLEKLDEDKAYGSKENNNRTSTNTSTQ